MCFFIRTIELLVKCTRTYDGAYFHETSAGSGVREAAGNYTWVKYHRGRLLR